MIPSSLEVSLGRYSGMQGVGWRTAQRSLSECPSHTLRHGALGQHLEFSGARALGNLRQLYKSDGSKLEAQKIIPVPTHGIAGRHSPVSPMASGCSF